VGRIAIAEFDMVSETNLQRQVLYGSDDVGKLKSIIATKRVEHLNSLIETERLNLRIDSSNSLRILSGFDLIVDATDNYQTRYIINDSCVILDKPMVHGSIYKYEGQVSVFNYLGGPTYRSYNPAGHAGETREQRIEEFIEVNRDIWVAGLREGTMFLIEDGNVQLIGPRKARIFKKDHQPLELGENDDFRFLLK
jgi:molybdopterin/thiamine biosynthesis adenylyltransferase